ncbi:FHS family L-fucose permease-like MFS transporter [Oxalobacteraceae bacterium GrIS 2.11]
MLLNKIKTGSPPYPLSTKKSASINRVIVMVMILFFSFGFCTVLVDTLIPKLKALFALSYAEVMLTQFCFFGAYFIVSLPASRIINRIGYFQSITLGLSIMATGCLSFTPAAEIGSYPLFLAALFILATGVTIVQVAVNPLATIAGDPRYTHSRLTLAQAFNSLATTVGPIFGATFILTGTLVTPDPAKLSSSALVALRQSEGHAIQLPFLMIASALSGLAVICWFCRHWVPSIGHQEANGSYSALINNPRLMFGATAIFLYVGAEVSIGSAMVSYLMQPSVLGASPHTAGSLVSVYWGMAMVGRFMGVGILKRFSPGLMLSLFAIVAATLTGVSGLSSGNLAALTLLSVGFCNSIMFPTIFSMALEGISVQAPRASGLLCLAIVGGAIIPVITGAVADVGGLSQALCIPVICYAGVSAYGWFGRRKKVVSTVGENAKNL